MQQQHTKQAHMPIWYDALVEIGCCTAGCACTAEVGTSVVVGANAGIAFSSRSAYITDSSFASFDHDSGSQIVYVPCSPCADFCKIVVELSFVIHTRNSLWYLQLRLYLLIWGQPEDGRGNGALTNSS